MNNVRYRRYPFSPVCIALGCAAAFACLVMAASPTLADDAKAKDTQSLDQAVDALLK
jgi:hypothetical protein